MIAPKGIKVNDDGTLSLEKDTNSNREWLGRNAIKISENVWVPEKSTISKALSLVNALTSGGVDDATFEKRKGTCLGCPALKSMDDRIYCGACGCPQNSISELNYKLKLRRSVCPMKKW